MKKLLALLLLAAGISLNAQSDFNFKGTITNSTVDSVVVTGLTDNYRHVLPVDKNGSFGATLQVKENIYTLQYGFTKQCVYLSDKTNLTLSADGGQFFTTLVFEGEGAAENKVVRQMSIDAYNLSIRFMSNMEGDKKLKKAAAAIIDDWHKNIRKSGLPADMQRYLELAAAMEQQKVEAEIQRLDLVANLGGKPSPQFSYKDVDGNTVNLSDFKGKFVVIDIWATWCKPCVAEIPFMEKIAEEMKGENVVFLSISIDKQQQVDKWKKFVADKSLSGVQVIADSDWNSTFLAGYGVKSVPRFIIVAPDGTVADPRADRPSDGLDRQLKKLLKKQQTK
jgi:thiol-disulfide isomerase/thioredoxin